MTKASGRLSVLFTTEGTYPYHGGGVSTWCHALISKLSDVDFKIFSVAMHPYLVRKYALAPNVSEITTVPLWGTEDPAEFGWYKSAADFLRYRWQTTSGSVASRFVPVYEQFLHEATALRSDPDAVADAVSRMSDHFARFDYQRTISDRAVWDAFARIVMDVWVSDEPDLPPPTLGELAEAWQLLHRFLGVLARPIPRTDLTHSAAAAFCGLPCVVAKHRWGTPYLLTEHGVYLREQYLNLGRSIRSYFVRWFLLRVASAIADVNYRCADQVSPVCKYNSRWEQWRGVNADRIHVIYNGVDPMRFAPVEEEAPSRERPLVVCVGLIFPLKGQLDLIEATALIRRAVPNVEVRLYGSVSDHTYFSQCETRVRELGLSDAVVFAGLTSKVWEVYQRADVVVTASISEGFPYAVVEAMFSGAAIVATDVGGVSEAIGPTGVLVNAHDPAGLAKAIAELLQSPNARCTLGAAARLRALQYFTEETFVDEYRASYQRLAVVPRTSRPAPSQVGTTPVTPFPNTARVRNAGTARIGLSERHRESRESSHPGPAPGYAG